jgi:hypothetical protein
VNYHSFLVPVINFSTDVNNPASVYLLDNGLELWNITVQNSVQMTRELLELFANVKQLLDRDSEVWKLCLDIIDAYIVLDANQLFQVNISIQSEYFRFTQAEQINIFKNIFLNFFYFLKSFQNKVLFRLFDDEIL